MSVHSSVEADLETLDLPSYVLGESCDKRYLMLGGLRLCVKLFGRRMNQCAWLVPSRDSTIAGCCRTTISYKFTRGNLKIKQLLEQCV